MSRLRTSLYVYVILVFAEGPLRKWFLPIAANEILLARDPVVLYAIFTAYRLGLFHRNRFIACSTLLGAAACVASFAIGTNPWITLYGWRSDFFHIPIGLLLVSVLAKQDLRRISNWLLALSLPNGLLMYLEFHSSKDSWLNAGMEKQFQQISLANDLIRPAGIFSFVTGPAALYPIILALVLVPVVESTGRDRLLRMLGFAGVVAGAIFSGSRYLWVGLVFVLAVYLVATARYRPSDFVRRIPALAGIAAALAAVFAIPSVSSALAIFYKFRLGGSAENRVNSLFLARIWNLIAEPFVFGYGFPVLGNGLGMGTIVGQKVMGIRGMQTFYLLGDIETEWTRHVSESGFIMGGLYIVLRIYVVVILFQWALPAARRKNLGPLLLWAAAAPWIFNGQIGQSTILGMTIFAAGFAGLAAKEAIREAAVSPAFERRGFSAPRQFTGPVPAGSPR
jgi:hypothetical protein